MTLGTKVQVFSLLLITVFSLISAFVPFEFAVQLIVVAGTLLLLPVLVVRVTGIVRLSYSFFFVLSVILSLAYHLPLKDILINMISQSVFIALFVCMPLIKIPIQLGEHMEKIFPVIKSMPGRYLNPMIALSNFVLCSFFNFGAIRVLNEFFHDVMAGLPELYGKLLTRSFSLAALWTPYFVAFSVAVSYSGASPSSVMITGLIFCAVVMGLWLLPWILQKTKAASGRRPLSGGEKDSILQLAFFFALLVGTVVVVSYFTKMNIAVIVSLASIAYSLLWCALQGNLKRYVKQLRSYVATELPLIREEAFLFISIGFFSKTLLQIGWHIRLPDLGALGPAFIFLFVVLFTGIVAAVALLGVHHLVTITVITTAVNWSQMGVQPLVYALTILLSWTMCCLISPFTPANFLVSRILQKSPLQVSLKSNALFCGLVLLGGALYLTLVNAFLGGAP